MSKRRKPNSKVEKAETKEGPELKEGQYKVGDSIISREEVDISFLNKWADDAKLTVEELEKDFFEKLGKEIDRHPAKFNRKHAEETDEQAFDRQCMRSRALVFSRIKRRMRSKAVDFFGIHLSNSPAFDTNYKVFATAYKTYSEDPMKAIDDGLVMKDKETGEAIIKDSKPIPIDPREFWSTGTKNRGHGKVLTKRYIKACCGICILQKDLDDMIEHAEGEIDPWDVIYEMRPFTLTVSGARAEPGGQKEFIPAMYEFVKFATIPKGKKQMVEKNGKLVATKEWEVFTNADGEEIKWEALMGPEFVMNVSTVTNTISPNPDRKDFVIDIPIEEILDELEELIPDRFVKLGEMEEYFEGVKLDLARWCITVGDVSNLNTEPNSVTGSMMMVLEDESLGLVDEESGNQKRGLTTWIPEYTYKHTPIEFGLDSKVYVIGKTSRGKKYDLVTQEKTDEPGDVTLEAHGIIAHPDYINEPEFGPEDTSDALSNIDPNMKFETGEDKEELNPDSDF